VLECDFCAGVDPRWRYPTTPPSGRSWQACQPCHELIEAGLWTELGARATTLTFAPHPYLPEDAGAYDPAVLRQRDEAWARFRATRQGPVERLERPRRQRARQGWGWDLLPWRRRPARPAGPGPDRERQPSRR
jgi:hypothetical protein